LVAAAAAVALAFVINGWFPAISPLTVAVLMGVVVGNAGVSLRRLRPGLRFAVKHLLRVGVVLLGLRLAVPDVIRLGGAALVMVMVIVVITFFGTQLLGRWMGVSPGTSLLVAAGFSICGASAVAAMDGVTRSEEDDVVTAIVLVTLFGCLAIVVLPLLQHPLGLSDVEFGLWAGASVHDVAQTVATASVVGPSALAAAVVVKLTRVVLLAPMVAGVSLWRRRGETAVYGTRRPPLVPLFVVGFLAMVGLRSTGLIPEQVLASAQVIESIVLAAALFGLGAGVHLRTLARTGGRATLLGLCSWGLVATIAYGGVLLLNR
jgi:uncharacterized integral membrane protein (TIGR00698 family)